MDDARRAAHQGMNALARDRLPDAGAARATVAIRAELLAEIGRHAVTVLGPTRVDAWRGGEPARRCLESRQPAVIATLAWIDTLTQHDPARPEAARAPELGVAAGSLGPVAATGAGGDRPGRHPPGPRRGAAPGHPGGSRARRRRGAARVGDPPGQRDRADRAARGALPAGRDDPGRGRPGAAAGRPAAGGHVRAGGCAAVPDVRRHRACPCTARRSAAGIRRWSGGSGWTGSMPGCTGTPSAAASASAPCTTSPPWAWSPPTS